MTDAQKILRRLTAITVFQLAVILVIDFVLRSRLTNTAARLRDGLNEANVAVAQVDLANQAFAQLSSDLFWVFLGTITLTCIGYGLLRNRIIETQKKDVVERL